VTRTCWGTIADQLGHAANAGGAWSTRSDRILPVQDPEIVVDLSHDRVPRGRVVHLERDHGTVTAVAEVDDDVAPEIRVRVGDTVVTVEHPLYWSLARIGSESDGYAITGLSLTPTPARVMARSSPVRFADGCAGVAAFRTADEATRELLERAAATDLRRHGAGLLVIDLELERQHERASGIRVEDRTLGYFADPRDVYRPGGRGIEFRPGGRILSVS